MFYLVKTEIEVNRIEIKSITFYFIAVLTFSPFKKKFYIFLKNNVNYKYNFIFIFKEQFTLNNFKCWLYLKKIHS